MIDAAVIGLGRWGKSLVTAVQGKSQKLRFIHGVSKEPDDVRGFAGQHGFRLSTDLADAIADPAVQAVFLATPHSLHVPQIEAVARAKKPVWCEKPLALTRKEAARAVAACRNAGIVLGSGNNKRCYASMRELKRVVESGELSVEVHGEPVSTMGPGSAFGEIALIDRRPRTATVTAVSDVTAYGLPVFVFRPFVEARPQVAWKMLEALADRLAIAESR